MQTNLVKAVLPYLAASLIILMVGCGGGGGDSSPQAGAGTLNVSLTDAPAGGFTAVNVTISKVRVHQSNSASENDAGWTDITLNPARKINLLNLTNGVLEDLGQTSLSAGHYTQLRLVLAANSGTNLANSVVLASDPTTEIALDTPSSVQSGIKLINEFDVASGQRVDLVLDFDALKSVVARGNGTFLLKPVIKVVPTQLNGIDGFVDTAILGDNVLVSAQSNGNVICSTAPNPQTGEFFLSRLVPGNYDVVITANGRATVVITGVPVANNASTTIVSTSTARFTLPTSATKNVSGTVTLNPASTTEVAYVAAKQTFGSGPTVTVATIAADPSSGSYVLTLPVDAPLLGQYGTGTLPIALSTQAAVAGKYLLEASAEGYKTQQVSRDVSAGATQDFTLVP
ncbi:MAG: DUF4382 domain-containing protein [Syntrophales bacterium]|nr:DUF4382 domain-containing protein [Syntrophales bacterium]